MNKELRQWIAENEDLEDDEIHYAALDALAPLLLYKKLAPQANLHVTNDIKFNGIDDNTEIPEKPKFLCDRMCANIDEELMNLGYDTQYVHNENYNGSFLNLIFIRNFEYFERG